VAGLVDQRLVERVRQEAWKERQEPAPPVHEDLVMRDITRWCGDPAVAGWHHRTRPVRAKLYLCAIKDLYSNRIVGYSISDRMKARLASTASTALSPAVVTWPAASCSPFMPSPALSQGVPWLILNSMKPCYRSAVEGLDLVLGSCIDGELIAGVAALMASHPVDGREGENEAVVEAFSWPRSLMMTGRGMPCC